MTVRIRDDFREWYTGHTVRYILRDKGVSLRAQGAVADAAYDPVWANVFVSVRQVLMRYCEEREL